MVLVAVGTDMDSRLVGQHLRRRAVAVVTLWSMVSGVEPGRGSRDAVDGVRMGFSLVFASGQVAGLVVGL